MKRHLLSLLAVAAVASFAGAQQPTYPSTPARTGTHGDSVSAMHRNAHAGAKHKGARRTHAMKSTNAMKRTTHDSTKAAHHTTSSGGEVDLGSRGGPGYSLHATSRDFVTADNTSGDDLWRREQMMDRKCGKSRERCGTPD